MYTRIGKNTEVDNISVVLLKNMQNIPEYK